MDRLSAICNVRLLLHMLMLVISVGRLSAEIPVEYSVRVTGQSSSGSLAPYMLGSWNEGRYVEGNGIWQEGSIRKNLEMSQRFSWSCGIDYLAGIGSKTGYDRWNKESDSWGVHRMGRSPFRFIELYGQLKYRSVQISIGMKNYGSGIVDGSLSSGDLIRSNNSAAIPGISGGFLEFQNIPFTKGWLQIDGEIMYGKMMDNRFKKSEFNYYYGVQALNLLYHYKRCYFRTNPNKNFHVTVGMQAAAMFGGSTYTYREGKVVLVEHRGFKLKEIFQMFFPLEGGEDYYKGNHVGSWDLKAVYRFRDDSRLNLYFEWLWDDGSGIGKMNGWDGLWGIQYNFRRNRFVSKATLEYLDFTNQSGPLHFDPEDKPDNPLSGLAQGADNYYNNDYYGAYSNYGMSIGSPFLVSPIYNRNGMLDFLHNRARGFHAAMEGSPLSNLTYRLMVGYENAGGYGRLPAFKKKHSTSAMMEARVHPLCKIPEFEMGLRIAFDKGTLRGDNFGAQLQLSYSGELKIGKSKR